MKEEFAIRALERIKEIQETYSKIKALGIDLIDYENGVDLLEESITILFVDDEADFESALDMVQWWLYDKSEKVITLSDKTKIDVSTPEEFIEFIRSSYAPNEK